MRYTIGGIVFFVLFGFLAHTSGGHGIVGFIHAPSLFAIVAANLAVLIMTGQFKLLIRAKNALLFKKYVISAKDKEDAIALFGLLSKITAGMTIMLTLMGMMGILWQLDNPAFLGPMISITMINLIYGALFILVFFLPSMHILKNRQNHDQQVVINEKQVINKLLELCYKQGISPEDILTADEIQFRKG